MTNCVVIKEVNGEEILLRESEDLEATVVSWIIMGSWILAGIIALIVAVKLKGYGDDGYMGIAFTVSFFYFLGVAILSTILRWGDTLVQVFEIVSSCGSITICKTTPPEDQKAICKAAQEIERKLLEAHRRENQLKQLADGCK